MSHCLRRCICQILGHIEFLVALWQSSRSQSIWLKWGVGMPNERLRLARLLLIHSWGTFSTRPIMIWSPGCDPAGKSSRQSSRSETQRKGGEGLPRRMAASTVIQCTWWDRKSTFCWGNGEMKAASAGGWLVLLSLVYAVAMPLM